MVCIEIISRRLPVVLAQYTNGVASVRVGDFLVILVVSLTAAVGQASSQGLGSPYRYAGVVAYMS
jgi:hypothetical protein